MANPYHLVVARKGRSVSVIYCGHSEVEAMAQAAQVPASKATEVDIFLSPAPAKILPPCIKAAKIKPARRAPRPPAEPPAGGDLLAGE